MTLLETVIQHLLTTTAGKQITLRLVVDSLELERKQVLRVLEKLTREGYLKEVVDNPEPPRVGEVGPPRRNPTWRVIRDLATRPAPNRTVNDSNRSKLWRLIRAKRRFTRHDLTVCSGISGKTVDGYVRDLTQNGYVRATGKDGQHTTYMLVRINQIEPPTGLYGGAK